MGSEFSIMDRLNLAFEVIMHWETLATLFVFVIFWILVRYVADPWRTEGRPRFTMAAKRFRNAPPLAAEEEKSSDEDDDMLPD